MSLVYVFAITRHRAEALACEGHRIDFTGAAGVAAAIEHIAAPPPLSEASLRVQHEIVLRIAAVVDEILPVRFGAAMELDELHRLLISRKAVIDEALDLVRGRVQMTIRARQSTPAPRSAPVQSRSGKVTGTAYLEGRRAAAVQLPSTATAPAIARVRAVVVAERHDTSSRGNTASTYHLIERGDVQRYRSALTDLDPAVATVSGPWPPFAFAPDLWS